MRAMPQPNDTHLSQDEARQTLEKVTPNLNIEQPGSQNIELMQYKEQEEVERHKGLDALVAEAQKLGMY